MLTAYSPLGAGRDDRPSPVLADPEILALAAELGATPAQVLLAWGLACGTVVIPKALRPEHLAANLAAKDLEAVARRHGPAGAAGSGPALCGWQLLVSPRQP